DPMTSSIRNFNPVVLAKPKPHALRREPVFAEDRPEPQDAPNLNFSQVFKLVRTKYVITYTEDVMLLRALLSILYIARFLGFEGFFPNYRDFSATDPICSLLRDKALAL